MTVRVCVAIPSFDDVKMDFAWSLSAMMLHVGNTAWPGGIEVGMQNERTSILPNGRNKLVRSAIQQGASHVLFLDSDMWFPPDTLHRLLKADKAVVAANCVQRCLPTRPTAFKDGAYIYSDGDRTGLEQVDAVGSAVMMIKTSVFDQIAPPAFQFISMPSSPVDFVGEDIYFCRELKQAGIELWVDHDLSREIRHVGQMEYGMHHAVMCRDKTPLEVWNHEHL